MKVLFDQGVPVPLRVGLVEHQVSTAYELGWSTLKNGELLAAAISSGFEVLITTDQNLEHQQNIAGLDIAVIVLPTTAWPTISKNIAKVVAGLAGISKSQILRIDFGDSGGA